MLENDTDCLLNDKIILKPQQRFKSYNHNVYTEEVNKTASSSNDDKRLQTFYRITTYLQGTNAFKVCESKMMIIRDLFVESYADEKRMQNKSIRLCKAVMMIKGLQHIQSKI